MATEAIDMYALAAKVRARREPLGLNVRFLREDGTPDEWSWRDTEGADRFRASLRRQGLTVLS